MAKLLNELDSVILSVLCACVVLTPKWPIAAAFVSYVALKAISLWIEHEENPDLVKLKADVKDLKEKMDAVTLLINFKGMNK